MRFSVFEDHEAMSARAAEIMAAAVAEKPDLLFCTASGGSPTRAYELFAADKQVGAGLRVVKLDEWAGLAPDDEASCETYVRRHLIGPLAIPPERYWSFDGMAADGEAECAAMERRLAADGPIDLAVLGVGVNGHIALNEPAGELQAECHVAALAETSKDHPMLGGHKRPPSHGLTLGMAAILQSHHLLVLISGAHKRDAMEKFLSRRITPQFPASLLWLHGNIDFLCDSAAMAGLEALA
ncbi:MAG: 6-phosphogluconolactonase [Proteobacteria bacterium]|nr:6-phosphogluconolactonase [Pseudomonadota bacterium]MDA1357568.1 6-phosphogluconolactonase [Pseudomonadota bacterium]